MRACVFVSLLVCLRRCLPAWLVGWLAKWCSACLSICLVTVSRVIVLMPFNFISARLLAAHTSDSQSAYLCLLIVRLHACKSVSLSASAYLNQF